MFLWRKLDDFINGTTMYRLAVYVLAVWVAAALAFSFTGVLQYSGIGLLVSLVLALVGCYAANLILSWVWNVPTNTESWLITALILTCIMPPATTADRVAGMVVAACAAMAGKYVLALHGKHLFNPAALGAVVAGWVGLAYAGWWIGTPVMLPLVAIGGLLVIRKLRRFTMVAVFLAVSAVTIIVLAMVDHVATSVVLRAALFSGPAVFLAAIMLTEPSTIPPRRGMQLTYAALIAVLFATHPGHGDYVVTPHVALVLGNVFSFVVSPKRRLRLQLKEKHQLAPHVYDYEFTAHAPLSFKAGQYVEWTLPHAHADDRGNRRTFTIASSPTEPAFHLGVKFYEPSSSFKRALYAMEPGQQLWAGHLTGDFTLPADPSQKMAWIAGGIGITPFRSMAQYLVDAKQHRDIVLLYAVVDPAELVYREVFTAAAAYGLRLVPVLTAGAVPADWKGLSGFLTADKITKEIPDYAERHFYLSGPNAMVVGYRRMLTGMHIPRRRIVSDYFSGY